MTQRLIELTSRGLARHTSRRGFLVRLTLAATAVSIAPLRYLLRPGSAEAVISCGDCGGGSLCCDGWTTFCCTLSGQNTCPSYTFIGGWWKCTDYRGGGLCDAEGVRYYVDCNRTPGHACPHGCSCTNGSCSNRSTCCNVFRYGQCNTQIGQVTEVVCRVITCVNPCSVFPGECSCNEFIENATCGHQASCLNVQPPSLYPPYHGLGTGGGDL